MKFLCWSCCDDIGPDAKVPMCAECFEEFLSLPIEVRMSKIAEFQKNAMIGDALERFWEIVEQSDRNPFFRGRDSMN